jgi:hypothetical protein
MVTAVARRWRWPAARWPRPAVLVLVLVLVMVMVMVARLAGWLAGWRGRGSWRT